MKRKMAVVSLIFVAVLVLAFELVQGKNDIKTVIILPAEYISLDEAITSSNGIQRYMFWESQISFLDSKGVCVYQTDVKDCDFIVKYKGGYYIDKSMYNKLIEKV